LSKTRLKDWFFNTDFVGATLQTSHTIEEHELFAQFFKLAAPVARFCGFVWAVLHFYPGSASRNHRHQFANTAVNRRAHRRAATRTTTRLERISEAFDQAVAG
jgi:hypothetical protein